VNNEEFAFWVKDAGIDPRTNKKLKMRIWTHTHGTHVTLRVFAAMVPDDDKEYTLGNCGSLILRVEECEIFQRLCPWIEFKKDKSP